MHCSPLNVFPSRSPKLSIFRASTQLLESLEEWHYPGLLSWGVCLSSDSCKRESLKNDQINPPAWEAAAWCLTPYWLVFSREVCETEQNVLCHPETLPLPEEDQSSRGMKARLSGRTGEGALRGPSLQAEPLVVWSSTQAQGAPLDR